MYYHVYRDAQTLNRIVDCYVCTILRKVGAYLSFQDPEGLNKLILVLRITCWMRSCEATSQQKQDVDPMLVFRRPNVVDDGPTLSQDWFNVLYFQPPPLYWVTLTQCWYDVGPAS